MGDPLTQAAEPAELAFRWATPDDAAACAAIYAPIVRETAISFEWEPPTEDEMRTRIAKTLPNYPWLVSLDAGGAVSGYVYAGRHRDPASYQWSVNTSVYVRADARGQGVGRRLYRALFERLVEQGFCRAYAGIALPNAGSVALHESVGFRPLGVYEGVGYKHGAWRDVGWWACPLQPLPANPQPPRAPRPR